MRANRLRERLDSGEPTFGTHAQIPWPGIIEIIGLAGSFDYVEYVGEYSAFSLELLENLGRALDLFPEMSSMMKVEEPGRGFIATRSLDAGIQNVLFTDCRDAAEVRDCIALVRPESPRDGGGYVGTHGVGMRRISGYGAGDGARPWVEAMNRSVVAIMIEKAQAMENLSEILEVEGVDMVQFGPADYSVTIGKPGQTEDREVVDSHYRMIDQALERGVHPRVEVGSVEQVEPFRARGVRHFCVGWDVRVLASWCRSQGEEIEQLTRELGPGPASRSRDDG